MFWFIFLSAFWAILGKLLHTYVFLLVYWGYFVFIKLKVLPLVLIKIKDFWALLGDIKRGNYFKRMFGIYAVVGEYGQGKTIEMSREYLALQHKTLFHDPDNYIFISNFGLGDTLPFNNLVDVLNYYSQALREDKGLIVFWDEIQNDYPENDFNFPQSFRTLLTQNRKNKGVRLIWSTQDYTRVNKNIRLMTTKISQMRCFFGRYMIRKVYNRAVYDDFYNTTDVLQKVKRKPLFTQVYIQTDKIRAVFDSFKMLDIAKKHLGLLD